MGSGSYSVVDRASTRGVFYSKTSSASEIFTNTQVIHEMKSQNVGIRESRDSVEHPNSIAIMIALDVTGSMGTVPYHLVKEGLPTMMSKILDAKIQDPQLMFIAVGDHEYDKYPLQIGQFESSDELIDKWLVNTVLEGGGGGNMGESYHLAWLAAAQNTSIDCFEKRGIKGFLFTIGDEPVLPHLPKEVAMNITGGQHFTSYTSFDLLEAAREKYNVYHIHVSETGAGKMESTVNGWKQLMQENLITVQHHSMIPDVIASIISESYKLPDVVTNMTTENDNFTVL